MNGGWRPFSWKTRNVSHRTTVTESTVNFRNQLSQEKRKSVYSPKQQFLHGRQWSSFPYPLDHTTMQDLVISFEQWCQVQISFIQLCVSCSKKILLCSHEKPFWDIFNQLFLAFLHVNQTMSRLQTGTTYLILHTCQLSKTVIP